LIAVTENEMNGLILVNLAEMKRLYPPYTKVLKGKSLIVPQLGVDHHHHPGQAKTAVPQIMFPSCCGHY
jgi:hypothetical protein